MNKFYTFVGELDGMIYHKYYEDGESKSEVVSEYDYTLYIESHKHNSNQTSLKNKKLKELTFNTTKELKEYYRDNSDLVQIHGNTSPIHQFIAKEYNYNVHQTSPISILNYDIEVEHGDGFNKYGEYHLVNSKLDGVNEVKATIYSIKQHDNPQVYDEEKLEWVNYKDSCYAPKNIGFPDVMKADQPIMSISVKKFGSNNKMYSLGTQPLEEYDNPNGEYILCKNEQELLAQFIKKWREINPDIVTGWNCSLFDTTFLINRIKKVLGERYASCLSPFYGKVKNDKKLIKEKHISQKDEIEYEIFGVTVLDYIELYKTFNNVKQESYKLDYIGEVEIGQKKVNFDEYGKSLMRLYEGNITVDFKTPYNELDTIMKYARCREIIKLQLKKCGYDIEKSGLIHIGDDVYKFDLDNIAQVGSFSNDELKGAFNYCDERVKTLSYKKFIMYNEQDANIVELLDNKMYFMQLALRVVHMAKCKTSEVFGSVAPWDSMIYSRLLSKNRQIPPRQIQDKDEKFGGAYVKDPAIGYHKWVSVFDLKSLDVYGALALKC